MYGMQMQVLRVCKCAVAYHNDPTNCFQLQLIGFTLFFHRLITLGKLKIRINHSFVSFEQVDTFSGADIMSLGENFFTSKKKQENQTIFYLHTLDHF